MKRQVQVFLEGVPLSTFGAWRDLEDSERLSGGCWEASWTMEEKGGWHHPFLRRGAHAELRLGPVCIWSGSLTEPDRGSWRITAQGYSRKAEEYDALNADGSAATNVSVATTQAISRGMPWATGALPSWPSHANPVATEETEGLNKLATLWDAASAASGRFWGVGPDRLPYAVPRPTVPTMQCAPGTVQLGVADDEFVTHINGRYRKVGGGYGTVIRGDDGTPGTPSQRWGRREEDADLTPRGPMDLTQATAIVDGMLARLAPRPGYANGFEVSQGDLLMGGSPVYLPLVRRGTVIRLHGVVDDSLNPVPWHDIVVGEIHRKHATGTATIKPLDLALRDFRAVLEGRPDTGLAA